MKTQTMKRILVPLTVLTGILAPAMAQKIETETSDRNRIVHVMTALNHLTVIEVAEPVVEVAAGSPSFKVEWRENKVFVQPTEADAATNLFIWTARQRLTYELEPAGPVTAMDFAIDQAAVHNPEPVKPATTASQIISPSITELLLAEKPVRVMPSKKNAAKPVEVSISDVYEKDGHLLIRYAVSNHGSQSYSIGAPQVYQLDGVRSPQSLYALLNSQLGDAQVRKLEVKQETPVRVLDGHLQSEQIAPGEQVVGVVALQMAPGPGPTVLRLQFSGFKDGSDESNRQQIAAFLVR